MHRNHSFENKYIKKLITGTSLRVQWLRLHPTNAGSMGSIPGWGTKVPHTVGCGQKFLNKINKSSYTKKKSQRTHIEVLEVRWNIHETSFKSVVHAAESEAVCGYRLPVLFT